jgi:hypothetical protein
MQVRRSANDRPQDDGLQDWEDGPHVRMSVRHAQLDRNQRVRPPAAAAQSLRRAALIVACYVASGKGRRESGPA